MAKTKARACGNKRRNRTEQAARHQLDTLVANRGAIPEQYRIYHCQHCNCWHVGHKGQR